MQICQNLLPPLLCRATCRISPIALAATSRRQAPPIPARPMPRTGSISPPGAGDPIFLPSPPHPQTIGLYITAYASGTAEPGGKPNSVSTIERRLSSLSWNCTQRGQLLIAISPRSWRGSASVTPGLLFRRRRLVKRAVVAAGVRGELSELERAFKFSGHSLRAGLASSADVDERYVQKQLGELIN